MGWFEKKGKDGDPAEGSADRASLVNLAGSSADQAQQDAAERAPDTAPAQAGGPQQAAAHQASIFGETADIEGSVEGHGDVVLRGTVRGSIHVTGALVIEPSGRVQADVAAREVMNAGTVEGNIIAAERVRVASSGKVDGDIDAPSIVIDDGGEIEGFIQMEPPGGEDLEDEEDGFVPPPPVKGLRSSLPAKPPTAARPAAAQAPSGAPQPVAPRAMVAPQQPVAPPPAAAAAQRPLIAPTGPPSPRPAEPLSAKPTEPAQAPPPATGGNGNGKDSAPPDADATLLSAPAFEAKPRDFDGPFGGSDDKGSASGPTP